MFDRCVCLNLLRRPDRWQRFSDNLARVRWPFGAPCRRVAALDSVVLTPPEWWQIGAGAWANLHSHLQVLDQAVADGIKSMLILEDDALLPEELFQRAGEFMAAVPDDWEQLHFGGRHFTNTGLYPEIVNRRVLRSRCVNGAWAYAVRGRGLRLLRAAVKSPDVDVLREPTPFSDVIWATLQRDRVIRAYSPHRWIIGHAGGVSDVFANERSDEWYDLSEEEFQHLEVVA